MAVSRQAIASALVEAFFVVLGVVLALAANEWRQQREDRRHGESALASVVEEIGANRAAVESSRDYHSGLLSLVRGAAAEAKGLDPREFSRGFVSPARVFRTAWLTASETGALGHIDYATVLELSQLYAQQARYEDQSRTVSQIIYTELFRKGAQGIAAEPANLASLISTFAYRESELLSIYDEALQALSGEGATAKEPTDE